MCHDTQILHFSCCCAFRIQRVKEAQICATWPYPLSKELHIAQSPVISKINHICGLFLVFLVWWHAQPIVSPACGRHCFHVDSPLRHDTTTTSANLTTTLGCHMAFFSSSAAPLWTRTSTPAFNLATSRRWQLRFSPIELDAPTNTPKSPY